MLKISPASFKQEGFFIIMSIIRVKNSDTILNFMYCIDN